MNKKILACLLLCSTALTVGCNKPIDSEATAEITPTADRNKSILNIPLDDVRYSDKTTDPGPTGFTAKYDVLAYFAYDADNKLVSTVQYFPSKGNDYNAIRSGIKKCVASLDAAPLSALPRCEGNLAVTSFADFTFNAPSNIVFVSRFPSLRFQGDEALLLSRSLQDEHPGYSDGKNAKPNKSFYGGKLMTEGTRKFLYVQNHYRRKGGPKDDANGHGDTPIGNAVYWYGMNLFMTVDQAGGGTPVINIIDPDGGNMGGGNP
jgi:hypothetical protein